MKTNMEQIFTLQKQIEKRQQRIERDRQLIAKMVEQQKQLAVEEVNGMAQQLQLTFPEVMSLLEQMHTPELPTEHTESATPNTPLLQETDVDNKQVVQIKCYVTEEQKQQIHTNMEYAHCRNFTTYARRMLLDGYIIQWDCTKLQAFTRELGFLNRSINQIVKRANQTGSIYAGDFRDFKEKWTEAHGLLLKAIEQLTKWEKSKQEN